MHPAARSSDRSLPREIEDGEPVYRAARIAQLRCVDSLVVDVVTTLLRESRPEPVILIVGDHGTQFADPLHLKRPQSVSPAFVRERFGAFGAFHLPAGGDSALSGSVTLVNVMGHVLRYYFGADLPPSSGRPVRLGHAAVSIFSRRLVGPHRTLNGAT